MPVHKRAVRVLLPRPNMQRVERRQSEAVGSFEVMEELSHKLGWSGMTCVPLGRDHQEVGSSELQLSIRRRFVNHNLRMPWVENSARDQRSIHVMQAHRSRIGSGHTSKLQGIAFSLCH